MSRRENLGALKLSSLNTLLHKSSQDTEWERHGQRTESEPRCQGTLAGTWPPLQPCGQLWRVRGDEVVRGEECLSSESSRLALKGLTDVVKAA